MNIALISNMTPAAENVRGTSALPFHLLVHRPKDVEVDVYTFDYNQLAPEKIMESENRLKVKINILPRPKKIDWILNHKVGLLCRLFMSYPIHNYVTLSEKQVAEIKSKGYDGIWIYGEEMSRVSKQFAEYKRCHLLPDCTSLFFYRMMSRRFVFNSLSYMLKNFVFYRKFLKMESEFDTAENIHYFLVGEADSESLRNINPGIQAHFLRHPHYDVAGSDFNFDFDSDFNFDSDRKIKLLVAGRNDYYMQQDAELAVEALSENKELASDYSITFLGKGWEGHVDRLGSAGYEVHHITFAEDYIEEISKHDIQLTPISIGTGTKGKVLDALSNGLLVIGTWYAMENIAVRSGESCVIYDSALELTDWLRRLATNRSLILQMANKGREAVLTEHGRVKVSEEFFKYFV